MTTDLKLDTKQQQKHESMSDFAGQKGALLCILDAHMHRYVW